MNSQILFAFAQKQNLTDLCVTRLETFQTGFIFLLKTENFNFATKYCGINEQKRITSVLIIKTKSAAFYQRFQGKTRQTI